MPFRESDTRAGVKPPRDPSRGVWRHDHVHGARRLARCGGSLSRDFIDRCRHREPPVRMRHLSPHP